MYPNIGFGDIRTHDILLTTRAFNRDNEEMFDIGLAGTRHPQEQSKIFLFELDIQYKVFPYKRIQMQALAALTN